MPSSNWRPSLAFATVLVAVSGPSSRAAAQQKAEGFAVDRLYPSAPGGGWFVMDALDMRGGLGGAVSTTVSYAHDPFRVRTSDGSQHLTVVSDQAVANFGFAATYDRLRLYANFDMPLVTSGNAGTIGGYSFTAPKVDLGSTPDSLSEVRIGFDARLLGKAKGPFRLGAGAQLLVPNNDNDARANYDTDGTYRAMARVLFAGDMQHFVYAGQIGVHVRPLDDAPTPGSPQGSELLFGGAAGARIAVPRIASAAVVIGPEVYGASAFRSFLSATGTALEGLLTGRIEGTADDGPQLRVKLGAGGGLNPHFGAAEWRLVFAVELFDHRTDRDKDGVFDSKVACPDTPGTKTNDPKTNGCPPPPRSPGDGAPSPDASPPVPPTAP